mmetsp:Transcript_27241/g.72334  ORF Transcript_27241/g.72334 Transcript_27241/m.72334 type:complete len:361 (+) Transcript_27241:84-1166(+)
MFSVSPSLSIHISPFLSLSLPLSSFFLDHALAGARQDLRPCIASVDCSSEWSDEVAYLQSHIQLRSRSSSFAELVDACQLGEVPLASTPCQAARLQVVLPVAWIHVPKTGTTFGNVLMYLPGMCPFLPPGYLLDGQQHEPAFVGHKTDLWCPGSFSYEGRTNFGDHYGVGGVYKSSVEGHGFIMLRQPEQRIISAYNFFQHSWPKWLFHRPAKDLLEYAQVCSGCAVKILTRKAIDGDLSTGYTVCGNPPPATTDEVTLAKQRLRSGFVFVGITDEWNLSICLLHAIFGGSCLATDFEVVRLGSNRSENLYDTSELMGYKDLADGALFEEASAVFSENLQRYNVSYESCKSCFQQASSFK